MQVCWQEEAFGGEDVYYFVCGNGFMLYAHVQVHQIVDIKYVQFFVCELHLSKGVF